MKILALDAASEACSVALIVDNQPNFTTVGANKIISRYELAPRQHTDLLLSMVSSVLTEAQLTLKQLNAIAFTVGPGSFTGVRIAVAVAQGLALGAGLPMLPISTLAAIAQQIWRKYHGQNVLVALDARMTELYWGCYQLTDSNVMEKLSEDQLLKPDAVKLPNNAMQWIAAGSGWESYQKIVDATLNKKVKQLVTDCYPDAQDVAYLARDKFLRGERSDVTQITPVYLRDEVVQKKEC